MSCVPQFLYVLCERLVKLHTEVTIFIIRITLIMAVHYKFNAAKEYDTLPVDGLHISLADLKDAIIHHKRLGRGDLCDLQVTNAETKESE